MAAAELPPIVVEASKMNGRWQQTHGIICVQRITIMLYLNLDPKNNGLTGPTDMAKRAIIQFRPAGKKHTSRKIGLKL